MKKIVLAITLSLHLSIVYAHGENRPGPHNGFIRMPGAFHTELVANGDGSYNVYLMDVGNQNATTKESSVKLRYKNKNSQINFNCNSLKNYFNCQSKKIIDHQNGSLIINAIRLGKPSTEAIYELPLKLIELRMN